MDYSRLDYSRNYESLLRMVQLRNMHFNKLQNICVILQTDAMHAADSMRS